MNTKTTSDNKSLVYAAIGVVALVAGAALYICMAPDSKDEPKDDVIVAKSGSKPKPAARKPAARTGKSLRVKQESSDQKPSMMDISEDEESLLTDEMKAILAELQDALDDDDAQRVSRIAEKILVTQRKLGQDAVPPVVREKAVEAIGFFLPGSLADLIGFMADSDPDVLQDVMDRFSEAIDDADWGDRELSETLIAVSKVLTDEDAIDALFTAVENDMRNSVAVETYLALLENGTQEIKDRLWESVSDFTTDDEVTDVQTLKDWLEENPDDEDDDEFYSGNKDDGKDDDEEPSLPEAEEPSAD